MGRYCALTLLFAALGLTSCHQVHDCIDEQVSACRNSHLAKCAWCRCRGNYVDCQEHLWDFGAGFREGYAEILAGGRGCPPAFAPRSYWSCCSSADPCVVAAWFDGYHHGVAAALADGYGVGHGTATGSADIYHRCCRRPVHIDLEQYKASMAVHPPVPAAEDDFSPLPAQMSEPTIPGPPPEEPYSPHTIDAPSDPTLPKTAPEAPQD